MSTNPCEHFIPTHVGRVHFVSPECWCRPSLRWHHEVETHNGSMRRVWWHKYSPATPPAGKEGGE